MHRIIQLLAGAILFVLLGCTAPAYANTDNFHYIIQDDAMALSQQQLPVLIEKSNQVGFTDLRITANWHELVDDPNGKTVPNVDLSNPANYPQEKWAGLDRAIKQARANNMKVIVDVGFWAPYWATSDEMGSRAGRANSNINPDLYAQFAAAVAKRYSGRWVLPNTETTTDTPPKDNSNNSKPPANPDPIGNWIGGFLTNRSAQTRAANQTPEEVLPKVDTFTIWNEPNLSGFIRPQRFPNSSRKVRVIKKQKLTKKERAKLRKKGKKVKKYKKVKTKEDVLASPIIYRNLLQKAVPAIKANTDPDIKVLVGATSATGSYNHVGVDNGVPPVLFLQQMACVNSAYKPLRIPECKNFQPIQADGYAHHPYTFQQSFNTPSKKPYDLRFGDMDRLKNVLNRLVAKKRISAQTADIWITEYGYKTGDQKNSVSMETQKNDLKSSFQTAQADPQIHSFAQFLIKDSSCTQDGEGACLNWNTGLFDKDMNEKPAFQSIRGISAGLRK